MPSFLSIRFQPLTIKSRYDIIKFMFLLYDTFNRCQYQWTGAFIEMFKFFSFLVTMTRYNLMFKCELILVSALVTQVTDIISKVAFYYIMIY